MKSVLLHVRLKKCHTTRNLPCGPQDAGYGEKSFFAPEEENEEDFQMKIDDEVSPKRPYITGFDLEN